MNYEQKYKDALDRARKELQECVHKDCDDMTRRTAITIIKNLFPELKESEYERTRKEIIDFLELPHPQFVGKRDHEKWIAWLEKQKNTSDKEYVFRPLAGDTIEKAAEKAVELDGKVVLAFNGAYIPVGNKTKDEIVAEYRNWVKKQGEHKTLNADEVIEWFRVNWWDSHIGDPIDKFKKDFGL